MKITESVSGESWRLSRVETEHFVFYIQEAEIGHCVNGVWTSKWLTQWMNAIVRPEFQASAIQLLGRAQSDAAAARRAAEAPNDCAVCLGSGKQPDDPSEPCGACEGKGRRS